MALPETFELIYEAICKDNEERPTQRGLQTFREGFQKAIKQFESCGDLSLRNWRIGLHTSIALVKAFKNTPIRQLDLTDNRIQDFGVVALVQLFKHCDVLTHIKLGGNGITTKGVSELSKVIPMLRHMNSIDLSNESSYGMKNCISGAGAAKLAESLSKNFAIQCLSLAGNHIGKGQDATKVASVFANMLRINRGLTFLDLNQNDLGTTDSTLIIESLARNKTLRHLTLAKNLIGGDIGRSISIALAHNTSLIRLDLSCNNIGRGLVDMASVLAKNTSLLILKLRANNIDDNGAIALSEALRSNTSLTSLDISSNCIEANGGEALAETIDDTSVLTCLDMSGNDIRDVGAVVLAECLVNNKALVSLNLSSCKIADDGAVAIATALASNDMIALRTLKLRDNYISSSGGQIIVDELRANTSITAVDFRGNRMDHTKLSMIRTFCKRNLQQLRNEEPKRLKRQIFVLKEEAHQWRMTESELLKHQGAIELANAKLDKIKLEKKHFMLKQIALREEMERQIIQEKQRLHENKAKIAAKRNEIKASQLAYQKRLDTLESQLDQETASRKKVQSQLSQVLEKIDLVNMKPETEASVLQTQVDSMREEKIKYQRMMTGIREKLKLLQQQVQKGEPVPNFIECARYALLHPEKEIEDVMSDMNEKNDSVAKQNDSDIRSSSKHCSD